MPWTLYRYILWELVKVLALATSVLVTVIALSVAIKPLSDGMLSAGALVKFVAYMMPTMLTFALPFAGAFAGAMVFHRLVAENEINACRASGLSYRALLAPVLGLGLTLTVFMFYLNNWVIPNFYRSAERTLETDMISLVVKQVGKQEAFRHGDLVVYADRVADDMPLPRMRDPSHTPRRLVVLEGVAVGHLNDQGQLESEGAAKRAEMLMYEDGQQQTWVQIRLRHAMYYHAGETLQQAVLEDSRVGPFRLESPFRERIKFMSWSELRRVGREPERYQGVRNDKLNLTGRLAEELTRRDLAGGGSAAAEGRLRIELAGPGANERYLIEAPRTERVGDVILATGAPGEPARIRLTDGDGRRLLYAAKSIELTSAYRREQQRLDVNAVLDQVRVTDLNSGDATAFSSWSMTSLTPRVDYSKTLARESVFDLIARARRDFPDVEPVTRAADQLESVVERLGMEIVAMAHIRGAGAFGCALILVLGALMALRLVGLIPLAVFFVTFGVAAVSVMLMHTGAEFASSGDIPGPLGVLFIWCGNLLVAALILLEGWRLSRN